jgi:hypothetical protein
MSTHIPKIPKGLILLMAFYDGTPITLQVSKEEYPSMTKKIKDAATNMINGMLKEGCTKKEIGDCVQEQQEIMHKKILSVAKFVSDEILEKAWGADWQKEACHWAVNVSILLRLKRIKNDDNYGWSLHDYNSVRMSMDGGDVACVFGQGDTEKQLKKVKALVKAMSK